MTTTTPHGQVPEALRLADELEIPIEGYPEATELERNAAAELRRLHAYCQELESQVIRDCMTHVQNAAEIEHVAGDVSKNRAEANMSTQQPAPAGATLPEGWVPLVITHEGQYPEEIAYGTQRMMDRLDKWLRKYFDTVVANKAQPAPATQQAGVALSDDLRDRLVAISEAIADQDDRAAQAMLREILKAPQPAPTAQADSQPAPIMPRGESAAPGLRAMATNYPPAQTADSVLEDAARLTYEQAHAIRQGHEISASDGYFEARPQIDSNDRRKVFQAGFDRGWDRHAALVEAQQPAPSAAAACPTCNDQGAVGNILTAEPCPDCTPQADSQPAPAGAALSDAEIDRIVPALEPVSEDFPAEWAVWKDRERIREELRAARAPADSVLEDAAEYFLEAQAALDNREGMGINAEPYEVLMRRRNRAWDDLEAALYKARKEGGA